MRRVGEDPQELLYLSQADVAALAPDPAELVDIVEEVFASVGRGEVTMPPGGTLEPRPGAFLHPMAAYAAVDDRVGLKWLSGYAQNKQLGLPFLTALIVLNDAQTGLPIAIMDGAWITAHRTAAASAVAIRKLAGSDVDTLSIIGCGVQARSHARVLPTVLPSLRRLLVHHPSPQRARHFAAEIEGELPDVEVRAAEGLEEALRAGRVLVSAGPPQPEPRPEPHAEWLPVDMLFLPLDFEAYAPPEIVAAMDLVVTDDLAKLSHFQEQGFFASAPREIAALSGIGSETAASNRGSRRRILCLNLGLAAEDIAGRECDSG